MFVAERSGANPPFRRGRERMGHPVLSFQCDGIRELIGKVGRDFFEGNSRAEAPSSWGIEFSGLKAPAASGDCGGSCFPLRSSPVAQNVSSFGDWEGMGRGGVRKKQPQIFRLRSLARPSLKMTVFGGVANGMLSHPFRPLRERHGWGTGIRAARSRDPRGWRRGEVTCGQGDGSRRCRGT